MALQLTVLNRVDSRWKFIHNVAVGDSGWDIDHLVVGPGGVFTINTKHHPGADVWVGGRTFLVRGSRKPYLRKSYAEAMRAAELLTSALGDRVTATGMIAVVDPAKFTVKAGPRNCVMGVRVMRHREVASWLLGLTRVLAADQCEAIWEVAARASTWKP